MPADKIDEWIKAARQWDSFIDIGGIGENSCNERVSAACRTGAALVAMADFEPFSHPLWATFRRKMHEQKITGFEEYENIDVRDPEIISKIQKFDFVHSTGITYHLPDPVTGIYNLSRLSKRYLVTNTVILPDVVENEFGRIEAGQSRAMFLPSVTETERQILQKHYRDKFGWDFDDVAPRLDALNPVMPYVTASGLSCYPYWWLFSAEAFRSVLRRLGFTIIDEWLWEDHTLAVFCERVP